MCFSSFFAIIWQKMKKNTSWKFMDESSVTFQSSISGPGEFGLCSNDILFKSQKEFQFQQAVKGYQYTELRFLNPILDKTLEHIAFLYMYFSISTTNVFEIGTYGSVVLLSHFAKCKNRKCKNKKCEIFLLYFSIIQAIFSILSHTCFSHFRFSYF